MLPTNSGPALRCRGDAGVSLVELMVTIIILGLAATVLVGGMGTAILASDGHRKAATADTVARDYGEALKLFVAQRTGVNWCSTTPYAVTFTPPAGYSASQPATLTCPGTGTSTPQYQSITVTATTPGGRDVQKVTIVVRPACPKAAC